MTSLQTLLMAYGHIAQVQKRLEALMTLQAEGTIYGIEYEFLQQGIQRNLEKAIEMLAELDQEKNQPVSLFQCLYNGKPVMLHGMN